MTPMTVGTSLGLFRAYSRNVQAAVTRFFLYISTAQLVFCYFGGSFQYECILGGMPRKERGEEGKKKEGLDFQEYSVSRHIVVYAEEVGLLRYVRQAGSKMKNV